MGKKQAIEAGTPSHDRLGSRIMSEWDICPHCGVTIKRTEIVEDDDEGVLKCDVCGVEFIANTRNEAAVVRLLRRLVRHFFGGEMQQLLTGFEPSEKDLVELALSQPLQAKIARSKALLQHYEESAKRLSPDGYYLAFSGGKDSCVIKQLAIESGVKFKAWYNLTTIDPPELVQFIKRFHGDVAWNKPKMPMLQRLSERTNGPPSRLARWCCAEYKEQGGKGTLKVIGVRVAESIRRARLWKEFQPHRTDGAILAPIAYWTDADVWAFIRSRNLPYCELYDQGFSRLGCIGCPLAGKSGQDREFSRWPKYEAMWKRAVFKFYDRWHGVPNRKGDPRYFEDFGSAQGLWDWWRSGKASEGEAQCLHEEMMMNV